MSQIFFAFLVCFAGTLALMPAIIFLTKKLKMRHTTLHYVKEHSSKSGTPTMGGIGFVLPLILSLFFVTQHRTLFVVTIVVTIGYAIIGFLDDFIKVFFKRNEGLSSIQKILFQLAIAAIVSVFAYKSDMVGGQVYLFFGMSRVDLGWVAIPLYIFIFLAFTNSVNLTDGLDGLASGVTIIYTIFFGLIMFLTIYFSPGFNGFKQIVFENFRAEEIYNLVIFSAALVGGLLAFLFFNGFPAKIFMGDTGSLGLGGALACLAIFSGRALTAPFLGAMYLISALSVIIQVLYFKKTKGKRVFLMAPFHHHLQQKGIFESKISLYYCLITAVIGVSSLVLIIAFA